ncbi:MAG TPA: acyl-CoA dehydrogenase family protein [Steroidobacteraceae bacterium]|nr:acyl-CoA dehydrogenase family protein [Steroidobacteraceae bacterium]
MALDLQFTPEQQRFRAEVREWMSAHVPREPLATLESAAGFAQHREWERTLARGNWSMITWPREYGGRGAGLIEWLIFEEEYYRAGAPLRVNQNGIFLLGPTLMEFGTPAQRARYLPRMAAGEDIWAQAWSEPQAGSDLAALRASATRDGDSYLLRGHKIWSSRAACADWAFGLFRTDPASQRHHGLSFLLVPLRHPGVRVRGIRQIHGEPGFAEIFFEDARVPVDHRIGEEGAGWHIAMATAGFERGLMLRSPARFQMAARRLVELWRSQAERADPALAGAVTQAWMDAEAYALNTYRTASRLLAGGSIGVEASLNKIFWSELDLDLHRTALSLLGARAQLLPEASGASAQGWLEGFLFALAGPIYAGTNEIQRNLIAERLLGLPRA